jgi:hypothetical protein
VAATPLFHLCTNIQMRTTSIRHGG